MYLYDKKTRKKVRFDFSVISKKQDELNYRNKYLTEGGTSLST